MGQTILAIVDDAYIEVKKNTFGSVKMNFKQQDNVEDEIPAHHMLQHKDKEESLVQKTHKSVVT